ncbi:MAG: methyltransferase domain-containing protein [Acidimicrobiia bacterium]|nr:methyltransferase domain-containing protein [Acidimicrobiia bacterium]
MPAADDPPNSATTSHPNDRQRFGLRDAYGVSTPAENAELYRRWAPTYEDDFMAGHGYVYHREVAAVFAEVADDSDGPVLDVGCGTGVVGDEIVRLGRWAVDGLDLSPEMLALAAEKRNLAGEPAYGHLIEADLTESLDIGSATYGSVVSAGTFTTGHVGPESIAELARIVRPGGLLVLGVNSRFFAAANFEGHLAEWLESGMFASVTQRVVPVYERADHEHGSDTAHVIVARRPAA